MELLRLILDHLGIDGRRLALEWISAAEGIRFVETIRKFDQVIRELGPLGHAEQRDREVLLRKLRASRMATEGMRLRMAFAKQAKEIKEKGSYGDLVDPDRLRSTFKGEMLMYETLICLQERDRTIADLSRELGQSEEDVGGLVDALRKKKLWEGKLCEA